MVIEFPREPGPHLPEIEASDFMVPAGAPGVSLFVRNKRLQRPHPADPERVVLFIHGATYPGSVAFDHPMFGGGSWLDYMAAHGFDAYLFDIRGYGRSSRPADGPTSPYARTPEAAADLAAVVDFIRTRTDGAPINLVGWSWGTALGGGFASRHKHIVRSLVMMAPLWKLREGPTLAMSRWWMSASSWLPGGGAAGLGAFRSAGKAEAYKRWVRGVDARVAEQLIPQAEFDRWWSALLAIQRDSRHSTEPKVQAPNGVIADLIEIWGAQKATYEPENIAVPTLLAVGEWDVDTPPQMAQEVFSRLVAAPYKRLEVLGRGTHTMPLELNRVDLYRRTREFLETRFV